MFRCSVIHMVKRRLFVNSHTANVYNKFSTRSEFQFKTEEFYRRYIRYSARETVVGHLLSFETSLIIDGKIIFISVIGGIPTTVGKKPTLSINGSIDVIKYSKIATKRLETCILYAFLFIDNTNIDEFQTDKNAITKLNIDIE